MKLSVVILNYNVRHFLELCIDSVKAATKHIESEIIVVDNNSPDDSCAMVKELFPEVTLIENKENLGFSKANNQGVQAATGEYICILNPDTIVPETVFESLLNFAKTKEQLGIVGCKLIDGTGTFLPESKRNLPVVKVALQKIRGNATNYYANHIKEEDVTKVDILVGAFMFMKRQVYQDLNGFDEDYFMYGEDIDLSYKALKAGYHNYYYGNKSVIHFKGESTLKDASYAKRFYGAMQIFYKKHFKSNIIFDTIVWFGIKFAFLLRRAPKPIDQPSKGYVTFSKEVAQSLTEKLNKDIQFISKDTKVPDNHTLIFDTSTMPYREIIYFMNQLGENNKLSFRILNKNSSFIIGSDSSFTQGEIISF